MFSLNDPIFKNNYPLKKKKKWRLHEKTPLFNSQWRHVTSIKMWWGGGKKRGARSSKNHQFWPLCTGKCPIFLTFTQSCRGGPTKWGGAACPPLVPPLLIVLTKWPPFSFITFYSVTERLTGLVRARPPALCPPPSDFNEPPCDVVSIVSPLNIDTK